MVVKVTFGLQDLYGMAEEVQALEVGLQAELATVMVQIGAAGAQRARELATTTVFPGNTLPLTATGRYVSGIRFVTRGSGASAGRTFVTIGVFSPYAGQVEEGTGSADESALRAWASRKLGIDTRTHLGSMRFSGLKAKIATEGTNPQPLFTQILPNDGQFQMLINSYAQAMMQRIAMYARGRGR